MWEVTEDIREINYYFIGEENIPKGEGDIAFQGIF